MATRWILFGTLFASLLFYFCDSIFKHIPVFFTTLCFLLTRHLIQVSALCQAKLWRKMLIVACDNSGRRLRNRGPSCCTWFGQTETRFYSRRHHTSHVLLSPVTAIQSQGDWWIWNIIYEIASVVLQEMITKDLHEVYFWNQEFWRTLATLLRYW